MTSTGIVQLLAIDLSSTPAVSFQDVIPNILNINYSTLGRFYNSDMDFYISSTTTTDDLLDNPFVPPGTIESTASMKVSVASPSLIFSSNADDACYTIAAPKSTLANLYTGIANFYHYGLTDVLQVMGSNSFIEVEMIPGTDINDLVI